MKLNHPVTGKEIAWGTNASIISKTDLKGAITYANETFCEVSGYSQAELLGKNHNIVRHPDVPPAAFQDLWDKLNAGRPWTGIVKNRAKNGDHYWVEAHVSPVYRDGRVVEYLSVRRAVSAAQIKEAEEVYRVLNQGGLPKPSWAQRLNFVSRMSMGRKLAAMGVTVLVALLVLMGALMSDRLQQLNEAERKIAGVEYIQPLRDLLQNLPQHRGFANGYLNGDSVFAERLRNKQTDIAQNLSAISAMDALHGISLEASELFERIVSDWSAIREGYERMDATTAFDRHTALIAEVIELIRQAGDVSGLTAVELLDQRYMVDLLVSEIPRVSETLGRARGLGAGIAAKGIFADGQKETLAALVLSVRASLTSIDRAMESIYRVAPAMKDSLGELVEQGRPHRDAFLGIVSSGLLNADQISQDSAELFGKGTALIDSLFTLFDRTAGELVTELSHAENMARFHIYELLFWGGMLTLFLGFVGYMLVRDMGRGFNQVINIFRRIADGHYYDSIDLHRFDELGEVMRNLKTMQVKLGADLAESREHGQAAMRVKTALDHASNPVMMAGNDGHIIYLNKSALRLFTEAESDLRKDLPHFKAAELFGANIDIFHKNPQHQRSMLAALKGTFTSEFEVGGRTLRVVANPVMDTEGQRLGTAVEWTDRTAEIQIEREVENIVNAARSGDLAKRISATGKMGFNARLSQGINDLLNTTASVFDEIALVMGHLSRGNLAHPMTGEYTGMYELIKDDVNESIRILKDTIQQLGESAESIDTASSEILAGNTNLSSRTEQQAGSLQETASSMEQLTSTVKANADNAIRANTLAANGKMAARKGGDVVHRAIGAMGEIRAASGRIGEIIGVIDEIAFQTNLLALNASVEAARAGEQGRGFAVVASEVRNLAGRSATAAKEIKELIQDTVAKVEVGSALVGESGARLQEIVDAVQNVGDIVSEIATASNEQYAGIEQVNRAVSSMDEVTQQNAALAEQTSAASGSMQEKTRDMRRLMEFFRAESVSESVDADRTQLLKARAAHLSWRSRIRDYLDGELSMSEKDAVSHRDCTLGKWLYAGGYERFSGYEAMKVLEPEHAKLHATIKDIVQLKQAGRAEEAERQYARIEDASSTVVRLLKEIEGRIN